MKTIADVCEGNPFYISSIFYSDSSQKDLSITKGLEEVLRYETLNEKGNIRQTWMEYLKKTFSKVNEKHAKNIVFYLCKHQKREVTRNEIIDKLDLKGMTEVEVEQKLKALVKANIINQDRTNEDYRAVNDSIFDKVFRGVYLKDIQSFDEKEITNE